MMRAILMVKDPGVQLAEIDDDRELRIQADARASVESQQRNSHLLDAVEKIGGPLERPLREVFLKSISSADPEVRDSAGQLLTAIAATEFDGRISAIQLADPSISYRDALLMAEAQL
jgi:hypothetical protein